LAPWTIGTNVSSGCIRMINQDVIDLYARASIGARVVVLRRADGFRYEHLRGGLLAWASSGVGLARAVAAGRARTFAFIDRPAGA